MSTDASSARERGASTRAKAGRRPPPAGASAAREGARPRPRADRSLEHRILLTATMCLLAFGAVMVYSASSATTLLQGGGYGGSYLVKFVVYGAIGLVVMRVLARDGVAKVHSITAPLLVASFVLVLAVHIPHVGVSVNGARRWIGPGAFQFEPSELMKLALVLYAATLLARRPQQVHDLRELARPLLLVVGAACLLVFTQPDLGTAMVIAFTVSAMLIAAGIPLRKLGLIGGSVLGLVLPLRPPAPLRAGPAHVVPRSLGARLLAAASRRFRARSRSARAGCSGSARASRCRRSSTCPRRRPTSSSR